MARAIAASIASAGTKKMGEPGSSASLISTRLSSERCRSTSIGVPRARCLIPLTLPPGGRRGSAMTFRASFAFMFEL
jgi:hypothetical protein